MSTILVVEDEGRLARFVELELLHEGYQVLKAEEGHQGLEMAQKPGVDLVLLDIMLPGLNGIEVLRRLRKTSDIPVILLTARDGVMDKVTGLDMGADDYISKPFSIEELLARIRTALRKKNRKSQELLKVGPLSLDVARHRCLVNGEALDLTAREFALLQTLMENAGLVLSRDRLLEKVWAYEYAGETNVVDVYIRYLRNKIAEKSDAHLIHTVRGVGYALREDEEA